MGSCRMNRSLLDNDKEEGNGTTGRRKRMKQKQVEFCAFRFTPWTAAC